MNLEKGEIAPERAKRAQGLSTGICCFGKIKGKGRSPGTCSGFAFESGTACPAVILPAGRQAGCPPGNMISLERCDFYAIFMAWQSPKRKQIWN